MRCPLLIVHSGLDTVCPVEESEQMRREADGVATWVVFPEGNHVCDNIPYKVRPLMADRMARQLRSPSA
jgi:dipeptidyl aminopeptidase/acylaminoacyl peptidase